jgi:hypothetical protein
MGVAERRMVILRLARDRGRVCMGDVRAILPYWASETLRLDLVYWVKRGELAPLGARRGRVYVARRPDLGYTNGYMMG